MDKYKKQILKYVERMQADKRLLQRIFYFAPIFYKITERFFGDEDGVMISDLTLWFFAIFTAQEPISTPPYQGFAQEKIQNTNFTISAQVVKK